MNSNFLLKEEQVISRFGGNVITLTNFRLRYSYTQLGKTHIVSLLLEKISSIELRYLNHTIFIILAICSIVGELVAWAIGIIEFFGFGVLVGVFFIAAYFFARSYYLIISSDGGVKISFHTVGMKRDKVLDFINQLESAIKRRREELK